MGSGPILGETKRQILLLLLNGETTAQALASKLSMNLSVVRRHLDDMVLPKWVETRFVRIRRGRPRKVYSLGVEGRDRISSKYDLVADLLTMAIIKDLSSMKADALYASAGKVLAGSVGIAEGVDSVLPILREHGFRPELRVKGPRRQVVSKNCPIVKLAKKYPSLTCNAFHTAFLDASLGRKVVLKQTIASGALECIHEF